MKKIPVEDVKKEVLFIKQKLGISDGVYDFLDVQRELASRAIDIISGETISPIRLVALLIIANQTIGEMFERQETARKDIDRIIHNLQRAKIVIKDEL